MSASGDVPWSPAVQRGAYNGRRVGATRFQGRMEGGLLGALARKFLTGESIFLQQIEATYGPGEALLAPVVPGTLIVEDMAQTGPLLFQKGAFLAAGNDVEVSSVMQKSLTKGMFSGTGLFVLRAQGPGPIAFGAYGSVHKYELQAGETRAVDNGHIVAWTASMQYKVEMANSGSIMTSLTSGEGLMCFFQGPGQLYVQSRNPDSFRAWVKGPDQQGGTGIPAAGVLLIGMVCCCLLIIVIVAAISIAYATGQTEFSG